CGRRMFLAALVLSVKYLDDRRYSNRAWARISGLSVEEVGRCERSLIAWLDWDLYIVPDKLVLWTSTL
ncbi:hypothetical protein BJ684DRAFT_5539, partial [Piptocephalis cylindrospora]